MKKTILVFILILVILSGSLACSEKSQRYIIFVYNSDSLTEEDLSSISDLRKLYPSYEIITADLREQRSACEIYTVLKSIRDNRAKDPSGIQIFGNPSAVPAFECIFETELLSEPQTPQLFTGERFVSDYFYTNFNNDPKDIDGVSSYELSRSLHEIDIIPGWPVVRLPLSTGQFTAFVQKYNKYLLLLESNEILNISISSPIFPVGWYSVSIDDDNFFFIRARDEWGIIDNLRLFGTTDGTYPSTLDIEGSCRPEDWVCLTETNICEIYHNSHATKNELTQTVFDGRRKSDYHCEAILDSKSINTVLNGNPYFLNTFGCCPAEDMRSNIIVTALCGECVGAFASTTVITNEDIDCMMSQEDYETGYTRYTLLYMYLYSRHNGATRTEAFRQGQFAIANTLTKRLPLSPEHSFEAQSMQSNMINLLGIHYFGLIEP